MVDAEYLRRHYSDLNDLELERLSRGDLVPEARVILEAEMTARGILPTMPNCIDAAELTTSKGASVTAGVYSPPKSRVADPDAGVTITVSRLVRLFQVMVVTSTLIGLFLYVWPFLPLGVGQEIRALRDQAGADAITPDVSAIIFFVLQPLWILSAVGLCFFTWWARPLFIGTYVLSSTASLLGGVAIWLPWEVVLLTIATLLDGAIFLLAYLPPLSAYFANDGA